MRKCTLLFNLIFWFIIIIFQIILTYYLSKKDYMKKKEYTLWNKKLITDITIKNEIYQEQKFDDSDSSKPIKINYNSKNDIYIWNGYSIYAYKRSFDYNYIKLRTLNNKNSKIKTKKCGKDFYNNTIYYPIYEKCPINFIEISELLIPSLIGNYNFTTIKFGNKYLHYTNEYIDGYVFYGFEIGNYNISCNVLKRFPSLNNNLINCESSNSIYDNFLIDIEEESLLIYENNLYKKINPTFVKLFYIVYGQNYPEVLNVNKKLNVFKYFIHSSITLFFGIIMGDILLLIILIIIILYRIKYIRHVKLSLILFYFYLLFMFFYLPLFITKVNLDYKSKYLFIHYLHFIIFFFPIIIIIFSIINIGKTRYKQLGKIFLFFIFCIMYFLHIFINMSQILKGKIDKGRFEDFYNIFNLPPIKSIELSQSGYILGKIKYSEEKIYIKII